MKRIALLCSVFFLLLTIAGSCYVLFFSKGKANAGYTVIPMVVSLAFLALYRTKKNK